MSTRHQSDQLRGVLRADEAGAPCWRGQAGLSLVELMVSMAISLVILAALVGMFVNTSTNNRELERSNSVIENGRLAIQVLESDVVHAGYWGSFVPDFDDQAFTGVPAEAPTAVPDPCIVYDPAASPSPWTAIYKRNLIGIPVDASDDNSLCPSIITNQQPNTDALVVRHAERCEPGAATGCDVNTPGTAGMLYFQASLCGTDVTPYVLDTAGFTLTQRDCATLAEKRRYESDIYYVRNYAVTPGDGIPTLVRSQFDLDPATGIVGPQPPVALIEGVEGFRVEFGVDDVSKTGAPVDYSTAIAWSDPATRTTPTNRGDGVPDGAFVRCTAAAPCTVGQLENVTAVKLYLLSRSRDQSRGYKDTKTYSLGTGTTMGPFNDDFKRHLFSTTIRLPNVAGRRETPPTPAPPPP